MIRINLLGAPGSGKSVQAAWLYQHLCSEGFQTAFVPEYIKTDAYRDKRPKPNSFDQLHIFAQQAQLEDAPILAGVDIVISECPLWLGVYYAKKAGEFYWDNLANICKTFDSLFHTLYLFIDHTYSLYEEKGRFENRDQSMKINEEMKDFFINSDYALDNFHIIPNRSRIEIANKVDVYRRLVNGR